MDIWIIIFFNDGYKTIRAKTVIADIFKRGHGFFLRGTRFFFRGDPIFTAMTVFFSGDLGLKFHIEFVLVFISSVVCSPMSPKQQEYIGSIAAMNNVFFRFQPDAKHQCGDAKGRDGWPGALGDCTSRKISLHKLLQGLPKTRGFWNHMVKILGHKGAILFGCPTCKDTFDVFKKFFRHMEIHSWCFPIILFIF